MSRKLSVFQKLLKSAGVTNYFKPKYTLKQCIEEKFFGDTYLRFFLDWNYENHPFKAPPFRDFINFKKETINDWVLTTDKVIRGKSTATLNIANGVAVFEGNLETKLTQEQKNHGIETTGFVNMKSTEMYPPLTLDFMDAFELKIKSDKRIYTMQVRPLSIYDDDIYQALVPLPKADEVDQWRIVYIPYSEFFLTFRGYLEETSRFWDGQNIRNVGFLMAERKDGPFKMEIEYIKGVRMSKTETPKRYTLSPDLERY